MAQVVAVAEYILSQKGSITAMKLQKLVILFPSLASSLDRKTFIFRKN